MRASDPRIPPKKKREERYAQTLLHGDYAHMHALYDSKDMHVHDQTIPVAARLIRCTQFGCMNRAEAQTRK